MPLELQIENTSLCNAACHFCVYPTMNRKHEMMDMDLYNRIVDQAAKSKHILGIKLTGLGEPLLDKRLEHRIIYARKARPDWTVEVYTNGVLLAPARFESLKEAGITSLIVSLNATSPEQHFKVMRLKDKYDQVCKNIDYVIAHRDRVHFEVHSVCNGDSFTEKHMPDFYIRWGHRENGGYGVCIREGNWSGDNRAIRTWKPNECCFRALETIYVLVDGTVSPCCFDPSAKLKLGDLKTQSLQEIYASEKYVRFREDHSLNRADRYAICANCTRI